jgi:hypothetical protein
MPPAPERVLAGFHGDCAPHDQHSIDLQAAVTHSPLRSLCSHQDVVPLFIRVASILQVFDMRRIRDPRPAIHFEAAGSGFIMFVSDILFKCPNHASEFGIGFRGVSNLGQKGGISRQRCRRSDSSTAICEQLSDVESMISMDVSFTRDGHSF